MFKTAFLLAIIGVLAALAAAARLPPKDIDPCSERKKIGPCKSDPKEKRFFYNSTSLECERFGWGGCEPNGNNFETKRACERTCVVKGRGCVHEGVWYRDGAVISEDPCKPCHCSDGTVACAIVDCFAKCKNPVYVPGQCCPVCKPDDSCVVDGITYENGAEIKTKDPCEWCSCFEGEKICAYMDCAYCHNPIWVEGQCCPQCSDSCVVDGITYENGAEIKTEDPCEWCSCYDGEKMCAVMGCAYCLNPIFVEGQCCPQCGAFWYDDWLTPPQTSPLPTSPPPTSPPPTTRPPPTTTEEHTAPPPTTTPSNCMSDGITYPEGHEIQSPNDPCMWCSCRQGELMCVYQDCMYCQNPIWVPGRCCPECNDDGWWTTSTPPPTTYPPTTTPSPTTFPPTTITPDSTSPTPPDYTSPPLSHCIRDGITYADGDYVETNDPCEWCSCRMGEVMCDYQECMHCQYYPISIEGQCCPECYDIYDDVPLQPSSSPPTTQTSTEVHGDTWEDLYGYTTRPPPTTAPPPSLSCMHDGITYSEGAHIETNDPCKWCSCYHGELMCVPFPMDCQDCRMPIHFQCCECYDDTWTTTRPTSGPIGDTWEDLGWPRPPEEYTMPPPSSSPWPPSSTPPPA